MSCDSFRLVPLTGAVKPASTGLSTTVHEGTANRRGNRA
ncbi:hypothetical protein [Alloactinosynnema sp. L-07]|nr:hypothetical protein [Alloactinosynnema sp. L-07]